MNTPRFIECSRDSEPLLFNVGQITAVTRDEDGDTRIFQVDDEEPTYVEQSVTEVKTLIEHATGCNVIGPDDCD